MGRQTRRRFKGHDPAEAARRAYETRRNPALWGANEEALKLAQNADVHTTQTESRTKTRRIERFDCFTTLKVSLPAFQAVRRFQEDLAVRCRVADRPIGVVVDAEVPDAELKEFRYIEAARRVDALGCQLNFHDFRLLLDLSLPTVYGAQGNWKATVRRLRGLIDKDAQAKCVRDLAESVRLAFVEIDNGMQRRAA